MTSLSKPKILFALCAVLFILFSGCKKKEIQGPQGDPGSPGGGGTANISSTNTFVIISSDWKTDTVAGVLKVSRPFSQLTKEVVEKGTVKVFLLNGSMWTELPYDNGDLFMQYGFQEGTLSLYYINIEGGSVGPPATATYRMVIIS